MEEEEKTVYTPEMPWSELSGVLGSGQIKRLRGYAPEQGSTMLVRLHAGGHIVFHSHKATVQHYILEGECESGGEIYGAGTYRLLPGHANVADITTKHGVTILMIFDPVE
jgi:quercetin dioxygenase-like cupin family protein